MWTSADGRIKLYLTHRALELRRVRPTLFSDGAYLPLQASGARREHVAAFARALAEDEVLAVAPRLSARLADVLRIVPVALLERERPSGRREGA